MADEEIKLPMFDLGIQESETFGNMKAVDAFLSGTGAVTTDASEIKDKNIPDVTTTKAPAAPAKKEEQPKPDGGKLAEDFLGNKEDTEEEEEETTTTAEDDDEGGKVNQFEALAKDLAEVGVFTYEDENPKLPTTAEEFLQKFEEEKQKGASTWLENFLSKHGEDRRELFDAIFVNGVDPKQWMTVYNEIENYENLDLASESNQEKVVRAYYKRGGWSDEKIQSKIDKLKSYQDLEEEATTLHPLIVAQDKEKLAEMEEEKVAELQKKEQLDIEYKASITKILQEKIKEKNIDGIPLDEKQAQKAYDFLYNKKWKTPSGELLTDFDKFILETKRPENIAERVKMALLKINNFDLSKIEKKAIAKESNKLFSSLAQRTEKKTNKQPVAGGNNPWANL